MERKISIGKIYRHFKGNCYYIIQIAIDSETLEDVVVYKALYGEGKVYTRKLKMFLESVEDGRNDNVTNQKYRFELIEKI